MPITQTLRIGCNSYLPVLSVSPIGVVIIDGDKGGPTIRWANLEEFLAMLRTAKESAVLLNIYPNPDPNKEA